MSEGPGDQQRRIETENIDVPPPPRRSGMGRGMKIALGGCAGVALLGVLLVGGCFALLAGSGIGTDTESAKEEVKQKANAKEEPKEEYPNPNFRDGTHRVVTDIEPGTYRTREGSSGCYYARLAGFSNQMDDILANDNANGPVIVTIEPTDAGFESRRCGTWTQDLSAITQSKTSFEEGTYIVGTDIEPGTYRSSGSSGCYYARLSGFGGGMEDIIANGNADAPTIVTIAPTDAGFQSQRCGTWSKVE